VPLLARWPGRIKPGSVRTDLQSLVDLTPTFLEAAGQKVPGAMTGLSRVGNWTRGEDPRRHVLVENRHQPTRLNVRTYVTADAKITVYRGETYGELYDLKADPGEVRNLWSDPAAAGLKARMLEQAVQIEIEREPTRMPRIAGA
jgi:arylsulfatase A-like enzyme